MAGALAGPYGGRAVNRVVMDRGPRLDQERFRWISAAFMVPAAAVLLLLFIGPLVYAFYLAFTNLELIGPRSQSYRFTGLANLHRMAGDTVFRKSLLLTLVFLFGSAIVSQPILGLSLALLMRRAWRAVRLSVGAVVIVAWVIPEITAALLWYAFA